MHASALASDGEIPFKLQERPDCKASGKEEHLRGKNLKLPFEIMPAAGDFLGLGIAVHGRAALEDIENDDVLSAHDVEGLEHRSEELPGLPDKGNALKVFLRSRGFAHDDEAGPRIAVGKDHVLTARRHGAEPAGIGERSEFFPIGRADLFRKRLGHSHVRGLHGLCSRLRRLRRLRPKGGFDGRAARRLLKRRSRLRPKLFLQKRSEIRNWMSRTFRGWQKLHINMEFRFW